MKIVFLHPLYLYETLLITCLSFSCGPVIYYIYLTYIFHFIFSLPPEGRYCVITTENLKL